MIHERHLLGCEFSNEFIIDLKEINAPFETIKDPELFEKIAIILDEGKVVGWFNGAMNLGQEL